MGELLFTARLHEAAAPIWADCLGHPFVTGIGDGTLPVEKFRYFMLQDYLYLFDMLRCLPWAWSRPGIGR